jgi:hypothetical protein
MDNRVIDFSAFQDTLSAEQPPPGLSELLRALWLDAKGDFDAAHGIAQDVDTPDGARVHAYLHRKEGDLTNARYWYRTAGVSVESGSLSAEWKALVQRFLG